MADADALLIRKLIVAALKGGDAHTDLGESIRDALSDFLSATWLKRGRRESSAAFRPRRTERQTGRRKRCSSAQVITMRRAGPGFCCYHGDGAGVG